MYPPPDRGYVASARLIWLRLPIVSKPTSFKISRTSTQTSLLQYCFVQYFLTHIFGLSLTKLIIKYYLLQELSPTSDMGANARGQLGPVPPPELPIFASLSRHTALALLKSQIRKSCESSQMYHAVIRTLKMQRMVVDRPFECSFIHRDRPAKAAALPFTSNLMGLTAFLVLETRTKLSCALPLLHYSFEG